MPPGFVLALATAFVLALLSLPAFVVETPPAEGQLLAGAQRVLAGDVPGSDFAAADGPATYYALAGAFELVGNGIFVERAIGLVLRLAVALGVFAIVLPSGRWTAVACAAVAGVVVAATGLAAYGWLGALALLLAAVSLAAGAGGRRFVIVAAGVLLGLAPGFHPAAALPALLAAVALVARNPAVAGRTLGLGVALGVLLELPYVAAGGLSGFGDPPAASAGAAEVAFVALTIVCAAALAVRALGEVRRRPGDPAARALLAAAAIAVGALPYVLARPDPVRTTFAGAVALGLLPLLAEASLRRGRPSGSFQLRTTGVAALVGLVALVALPLDRDVQERFGVRESGAARVKFADRFYFEEHHDVAAALNELLPVAAAAGGPALTTHEATGWLLPESTDRPGRAAVLLVPAGNGDPPGFCRIAENGRFAVFRRCG